MNIRGSQWCTFRLSKRAVIFSYLQEANGQFRNLLSQQGGELEKLIRKLGPSIDRARPFYDAKGAGDELHKKCLEAAAQFHRATGNKMVVRIFN